MAEGGGGGPQISFKFQVGLTKDRVVVDSIDLTLKSIKTLACDFINEKFPEHGISRLAERLMVFRHDYTATNALQVKAIATKFLRLLSCRKRLNIQNDRSLRNGQPIQYRPCHSPPTSLHNAQSSFAGKSNF